MHKWLAGLLVAVCATISAAETDVTVSNVVARQRYPWNGLVDVTCTVSGIDVETNGLNLAVAAVMPDTGRARSVTHFQVERGGKWSDDSEIRTNGNYRLLWDASADLGPVLFTNLVVRVTFDTHEKVQLWEGGPYWATTNVGAENPWEYGLFFWWGDTIGYRREGDAWVASDGSSKHFSFEAERTPTDGKTPAALRSAGWVVSKDGTFVLAPEHDAAQVHWGGGWRIPTSQELHDLCYNKCDWDWMTMNGVNGYVVRGRGDYASASIFLPTAGYGLATSLNSAGRYGNYWSSVPYSGSGYCSWYLLFYRGYNDMDYARDYTYGSIRGCGFSVRPVQGAAQ